MAKLARNVVMPISQNDRETACIVQSLQINLCSSSNSQGVSYETERGNGNAAVMRCAGETVKDHSSF